jgi:ribosomal protein S20
MDSKIKKLVAGVALAGALTAGTAGVAFAADGSTSTTTDPSAQTTRRHPLIRLEIRRGVMKVVTDTLGVSREELRDALKSGQTLSQYTTSLGKDPQAVVDALTNAATTKLDQLVADGTIKQERADTITSKLPERINTLMNHQFGQHATA